MWYSYNRINEEFLYKPTYEELEPAAKSIAKFIDKQIIKELEAMMRRRCFDCGYFKVRQWCVNTCNDKDEYGVEIMIRCELNGYNGLELLDASKSKNFVSSFMERITTAKTCDKFCKKELVILNRKMENLKEDIIRLDNDIVQKQEELVLKRFNMIFFNSYGYYPAPNIYPSDYCPKENGVHITVAKLDAKQNLIDVNIDHYNEYYKQKSIWDDLTGG